VPLGGEVVDHVALAVDAQRRIAPFGPAAMHVRSLDEVADAHHRTDTDKGEPLQMIESPIALRNAVTAR